MARAGERHPTRRPHEKRGSELVFELVDLPADRGLRNAQARGRTTDVTLVGDGDEVPNLRQAHATRVAHTASATSLRDRSGIGSLGRRCGILGGMAVEILGPGEMERLRRAGRAAAATLAFVGERLRPGVTTADVDRWVREHTAALGGRCSQLGYKGFPAAVCVSPNDVVCHGIPDARVALRPGDIVNVDVTTEIDGFHGDTSATFVMSGASPDALRLVDVARRCRDAGMAVVRDGARLGDVGAAVEEVARAAGCTVVREFGGHGIGRRMHMDPHVPHTGRRGTGPRLRAGMALTIEPMINLGGAAVHVLGDGWTVVTSDGSLSAQFEHTVLVTQGGAEIVTYA